MTECQAIAASKLRRLGLAAGKLINHLTFCNFNVPDRDRKAQFFGDQLNFNGAQAYFADKGMAIGVATLGGVGHRQQKALVTACQVL